MSASIRYTGRSLGPVSSQLLGNNIEAYENTIPSMLSERLRNPKFAGPENPQTGIAAEWEPYGTTMTGFSCKLVPGMYLSGREAQLVHAYQQIVWGTIVQPGVAVRAGEEFEVELWARAQHRPAKVAISLHLPGQPVRPECRAEITLDLAHWQRRTCRIQSPGEGGAYFTLAVEPEGRVIFDQVHLRPAGEGNVSRALLEAFDRFPCPVLRFPGGCVSCTYHWERGTGPVYLRPVEDDPVFKYKVYYDFGTDEYLELCAARGIRPLITLNTTTATPEQAAGWAAYVRAWYVAHSLPVPAAYFMFGNENYWIHELGHMTGEMYAAQLREFVPAVRAAYPEAKMLAIGEFESGGLRDEFVTPWRATVMERAADLFDTLVVTRYASANDALPFEQGLAHMADCVTDKEADLARHIGTLHEAGLARTIGIVEWNVFTRSSHNDHLGFYEPHDIRHCLYAAGYLNALSRLGPQLELACFYSLVNTMGMLHIKDGQVRLDDMARVLNLYAEALPGEALELAVDAPRLTEKSSAISAAFIRKGNIDWGFLVNYSAEPLDIRLEELGNVIAVRGLSSQAYLAPLSEIHPEFTAGSVTLPPWSLVNTASEIE
ncbi:MAG: hypothetical protein LLG44_13725 [Chloroflexi bacterium]|nr:hypothetical protein [Chloroflexota bacterium]